MNNTSLLQLLKRHQFTSLSGLMAELESKLKKRKHQFKTRLKEKEMVNQFIGFPAILAQGSQEFGRTAVNVQHRKPVTRKRWLEGYLRYQRHAGKQVTSKHSQYGLFGVVRRKINAKVSKDTNCNAAYRLRRKKRQNKILFPILSLKRKKRALQKKGVIGANLYKKKGKERYLYLNNYFSKKRVVLFFRDKQEEKGRTRVDNRKKDSHPTTIHVLGTYNNTIYTLSPSPGKTGFCISTGMCGFKNSRKSTSYAAQKTAEKLFTLATKYANVHIKMRGLGPGKVGGVRSLYKSGLKITNIQECTGLPHNGCRSAKRRRL